MRRDRTEQRYKELCHVLRIARHRQFIKHWFQFLVRTYWWRIRLYVGLQTYYFIDEFLIIKFDRFFFLQQCNYILVWKFVILFFFSLRFCFFFLSRILFIIYRKRLLILLEGNIHWCSRFVQFSTCNFCLSILSIQKIDKAFLETMLISILENYRIARTRLFSSLNPYDNIELA